MMPHCAEFRKPLPGTISARLAGMTDLRRRITVETSTIIWIIIGIIVVVAIVVAIVMATDKRRRIARVEADRRRAADLRQSAVETEAAARQREADAARAAADAKQAEAAAAQARLDSDRLVRESTDHRSDADGLHSEAEDRLRKADTLDPDVDTTAETEVETGGTGRHGAAPSN